MGRYIVIFMACVLLSNCAHTRDPFPVQTVQSGDETLTCEQIRTEYCTSVEIAAAKIEKNQSNDVNDVLLFTFIWPGLADFKNADGTEGNALLDRCIHLKNLAIQKGCKLEDYPAPPERYK